MILLDTNVVSAVIGDRASLQVERWIGSWPREEFWLPVVVLFEVRAGLLRMPPGGRRETLLLNFKVFFEEGLAGRVAPVDEPAAEMAATLDASRRARGAVVDLADTLIAGIAVSRRATLATRNLRHFADLPTPVVDPWTA